MTTIHNNEPFNNHQYRMMLMQENATIDSALKSYASWMMARTSTIYQDWTIPEILSATRSLSIRINQYIFPAIMTPSFAAASTSVSPSAAIADVTRTEGNDNKYFLAEVSSSPTKKISLEQYEIIAQVWNEVIANREKPTKHLGRTCLQVVWNDLALSNLILYDDHDRLSNNDQKKTNKTFAVEQLEEREEKNQQFVTIFASMLFPSNVEDESESHLLWDADGGKQELAQRAKARQDQAKQRQE